MRSFSARTSSDIMKATPLRRRTNLTNDPYVASVVRWAPHWSSPVPACSAVRRLRWTSLRSSDDRRLRRVVQNRTPAPARGTPPGVVSEDSSAWASRSQRRRPLTTTCRATVARQVAVARQRSVMATPTSLSIARQSGSDSPNTLLASPSMPFTKGAARPSMLKAPASPIGSPLAT